MDASCGGVDTFWLADPGNWVTINGGPWGDNCEEDVDVTGHVNWATSAGKHGIEEFFVDIFIFGNNAAIRDSKLRLVDVASELLNGSDNELIAMFGRPNGIKLLDEIDVGIVLDNKSLKRNNCRYY